MTQRDASRISPVSLWETVSSVCLGQTSTNQHSRTADSSLFCRVEDRASHPHLSPSNKDRWESKAALLNYVFLKKSIR